MTTQPNQQNMPTSDTFSTAQGFANYVRQTLGSSPGIENVNLNTQGSTPTIVAHTNNGKTWNLRVEEEGGRLAH